MTAVTGHRSLSPVGHLHSPLWSTGSTRVHWSTRVWFFAGSPLSHAGHLISGSKKPILSLDVFRCPGVDGCSSSLSMSTLDIVQYYIYCRMAPSSDCSVLDVSVMPAMHLPRLKLIFHLISTTDEARVPCKESRDKMALLSKVYMFTIYTTASHFPRNQIFNVPTGNTNSQKKFHKNTLYT